MYDIINPPNGSVRPALRSARPQTVPPVVPSQYLSILQSIKFNKGVNISWLAAVCETTGWLPTFQTINTQFGRTTTRQFAMPGFYADVPEIHLAGQICNAGWYPQKEVIPGMYTGCETCSPMPCCSPGELAFQLVLNQLNIAADVLKYCADLTRSACGVLNGHMFVAWQLGCHYIPTTDPVTGLCTAINIPDWITNEADRIVELQNLFAQQYNEVPIGKVKPAPGLAVVLTVDHPLSRPNTQLTMTATPQGGVPPYSYAWTFGDGQTVTTTVGQTVHMYTAEGNYAALVTVRDSAGTTAQSSSVPITISKTAPPPPGGGGSGLVWVGLLGLLGLVGIFGLASAGKGGPGGKREEALKKRRQAQDNRTRATQFRAQAAQLQATDPKGAADLQGKATDLEREATKLDNDALRLEQEAARDEMEKAASQYR